MTPYKILDKLSGKLLIKFYIGLYFPWRDAYNLKECLSESVSELSTDLIDTLVDRQVDVYIHQIEVKVRLEEVEP
jgi:hypothetical protein